MALVLVPETSSYFCIFQVTTQTPVPLLVYKSTTSLLDWPLRQWVGSLHNLLVFLNSLDHYYPLGQTAHLLSHTP
jgi:hypothetical protein